MSFFKDVHFMSITENEKNIRFWENYLNNLQSTNLATFADKLKVPILVPIGGKIFFRGELKHTNEVTVALGADYFVKCSLKQAEVLRQHRIKDALTKLNTYKKEREYLDSQLSFRNENINENQGQEIVEYHTDEEDKMWREKHRDNVRNYMQNRSKDISKDINIDKNDEELFNRLEELELQEELENELLELKGEQEKDLHSVKESFVIKNSFTNNESKYKSLTTVIDLEKDKQLRKEKHMGISKDELLRTVLDKQNELEKKVSQLRSKENIPYNTEKELMTGLESEGIIDLKSKVRIPSNTELEMIARLEEMEEIDELEDEMDRLDDILETEYNEYTDEEDTSSPPPSKINRRVSFADEDDSETLELTFKHSKEEPSKHGYDPEKGILRPSDIYEAYSSLFSNAPSILKKSKYKRVIKTASHKEKEVVIDTKVIEEDEFNRTIIVKDIVEKVCESNVKLEDIEKRPVSLFKKKRQQKML